MKIYKEDYKHFRVCQKLAWFLNEKNYELAKKLIEDKKIISFIDLTNTKTSSKIDESIRSANQLDDSGTDSEEEIDSFYAGETLADGLETGSYAQQYFKTDYQCFNFELNKSYQTSEKLQDQSYQVFFEPRFEFDNCVTKCDILKRNGKDWDLFEVKAVTWVKEEHMWDLLYQYDILTKCGIKVVNLYIMYLNNNYVRKEKIDLKELFIAYGTHWQKSSGSQKSYSLFDSIKEEIANNNLSADYYEVNSILKIKNYQNAINFLSQNHCHQNQPDFCPHIFSYFDVNHTIFQLYRLRKKKKALWYYEHNLLEINDPNLLTFITENKLHLRQYDIAKNGEKIIDLQAMSSLKRELDKYQYPVYMYDFETMKSAIPKFKNSRPYQQIPFQYSVHILKEPDFDFKTNHNIEHYQFLADGETDPRPELTKNLCFDLTKRCPIGTYVAYNQSFEKMVIKSLMKIFPEYQTQLATIFMRTIDLQDFFKEFKVYKSTFYGSLSIKKTLPAFAPNFSYNDLAIHKGDMASEAFRRRVENNITLSDWKQNFYQHMLDYCTRDTLGMVVLFWEIQQLLWKNLKKE